MYNHTPENYTCPICLAIKGVASNETMIRQEDIFYRDDFVVGFIGSKFIEGNEGYPMVVPVNHFENIYDLPPEYAHHIVDIARDVSIALKKIRNCDGVKLIQNNEPASGQHAFHYHLHVIPRFEGDDFQNQCISTRVSTPEERIDYAAALREYFLRYSE